LCTAIFTGFMPFLASRKQMREIVGPVREKLYIASTMTMGWHYGVDVIAGLLLSALCAALASWIMTIGRARQ
jgi:membrane-associated phospholipid phosphatase